MLVNQWKLSDCLMLDEDRDTGPKLTIQNWKKLFFLQNTNRLRFLRQNYVSLSSEIWAEIKIIKPLFVETFPFILDEDMLKGKIPH